MLMTAEMNARRLRRKNTKALRLAIEQSEREATKATIEVARVIKLKQQQDRAIQLMKGRIIISDFSNFV